MIRTVLQLTSAALVILALVALPGCGGSKTPAAKTPATKTDAKAGHSEGDGHDHSKDKAAQSKGDGHDHSKDKH
jgi:predicted small lipoprotein YifL